MAVLSSWARSLNVRSKFEWWRLKLMGADVTPFPEEKASAHPTTPHHPQMNVSQPAGWKITPLSVLIITFLTAPLIADHGTHLQPHTSSSFLLHSWFTFACRFSSISSTLCDGVHLLMNGVGEKTSCPCRSTEKRLKRKKACVCAHFKEFSNSVWKWLGSLKLVTKILFPVLIW